MHAIIKNYKKYKLFGIIKSILALDAKLTEKKLEHLSLSFLRIIFFTEV